MTEQEDRTEQIERAGDALRRFLVNPQEFPASELHEVEDSLAPIVSAWIQFAEAVSAGVGMSAEMIDWNGFTRFLTAGDRG